MQIQDLITRLIQREGGFVHHKADRGGATNMGITLKTLMSWRDDNTLTAKDVFNLTIEEAREIYYDRYWIDPGFFTLNVTEVLQEMLFDAAVLHGPATATHFLQTSVKARPDGVIGPRTREALSEVPQIELASRYMGQRIAFMGALITNRPSQAVFAHGWMNRMREFILLIPQAKEIV